MKIIGTVFFMYGLCALWVIYPSVEDISTVIDSGDPLLNACLLENSYRNLIHNLPNLFDAFFFYNVSQPVTFSEPLITPVLLFFPLFLFSDNIILNYNIVLLLGYLLSAVSMFILLRHLTGLVFVSFLGGFLFAFNYLAISHIHWIQLSAYFIPITIYFTHRFVTERKWIWCIATVITLISQLYFGLYNFVYLSVLISIFGINGILLIKQETKKVLFCCLIGILFASPIVYNYSVTHKQYNLQRTSSEFLAGSAEIRDYFRSPKDSIYNQWLSQIAGETEVWWEKVLFPGFTVLVLATIGLFALRNKNLFVISFLTLSSLIIFFILSMGTKFAGSTWQSIYSSLPIISGLRTPARAAIGVNFCLVIFASLGLYILYIRFPKYGRIGVGVAALCVVIEFATYPVNRIPNQPIRLTSELPEVYQIIKDSPQISSLVELPLLPPWEQTEQMYYALLHHKPILHGYTGYPSPLIEELKAKGEFNFELSAIQYLSEIGVSTAKLNKEWLTYKNRTKKLHQYINDGLLSLLHETHNFIIVEIKRKEIT